MTPLYHFAQEPSIPATSGIYRITCTVSKKFYIGSAVNLYERFIHHRYELRRKNHRNRHLQNAWNKYGEESFTLEIIELVLVPFLLEREQYWLDTLKPFGKKGYNIARSAQAPGLGLTHSPETIEKMRAAHRGKKKSPEHVEKMRLNALGKKKSEETIRKTAEANRGKKRSPEAREKFRLVKLGHAVTPKVRAALDAYNARNMKTYILTSPDGVEHIIHGLQSFCREHHLHPTGIVATAKGKQSHHHGWKARYLEVSEG